VLGRDHLLLTDIDIGQIRVGEKIITNAELGSRVHGWIKEGLGAWK
jgi:hypothetical protein